MAGYCVILYNMHFFIPNIIHYDFLIICGVYYVILYIIHYDLLLMCSVLCYTMYSLHAGNYVLYNAYGVFYYTVYDI